MTLYWPLAHCYTLLPTGNALAIGLYGHITVDRVVLNGNCHGRLWAVSFLLKLSLPQAENLNGDFLGD